MQCTIDSAFVRLTGRRAESCSTTSIFEEGKTNGGVQCRLLSLTSENQDIPERTSQMAYRCLWGYGIEADLIVGARCYQFFSDVVERDGWGFEV